MSVLMQWAMKTPRATLGVAAVVTFFAATAAAQAPASLNKKEYQAITAKYIWTYLDELGRTVSFSGTVYRSADGSISQIDETGGPRGVRGTSQEIVNPARRSWTTAESFTGTSTTMLYRDERRFQSLMDVNFGACAILEDESVKRLGESQFLGVKIIDIEAPMGRASVLRKSIAPELDCFPLQSLLIDHGVVRTT